MIKHIHLVVGINRVQLKVDQGLFAFATTILAISAATASCRHQKIVHGFGSHQIQMQNCTGVDLSRKTIHHRNVGVDGGRGPNQKGTGSNRHSKAKEVGRRRERTHGHGGKHCVAVWFENLSMPVL